MFIKNKTIIDPYRHTVHELRFSARFFFFSLHIVPRSPEEKPQTPVVFSWAANIIYCLSKFLTFSLNVHVNATCPLWQPRIFTQYNIAFSSKDEKSPTAIMHRMIELPLWSDVWFTSYYQETVLPVKAFLLFHFFLD